MTHSLDTPPLSTLLASLFAEAEKSDSRWAEMPASERAALLAAAKDDYHSLYERAKYVEVSQWLGGADARAQAGAGEKN